VRNYQSKSGQRKSFVTRLSNILNRQLPLALIKTRNPLFERQLKLLKWPPASRLDSRFIPISKVAILKDYTWRIGCFIPLIFAIPIAVTALSSPYSDYFLSYMLFAALGFSLLCNIYFALAAINTILPQIKDARWESLRLTALTESDILLANYATIQMRVWRVVVVEVAVRVFTGLTTALLLIRAILRMVSYSRSFGIEYMGVYLVIVTIIGVYILEPLWRMRAVTLIGMTIATWLDDYGIAVIVAFAAVLALLVAEIIVIVCSLWFDVAIAASIFIGDSYTVASSVVLALLIFVLCAPLPVVGLYVLFRVVQSLVFARLERVAFRNV
jgi:hypothetical protein